MHKIYVVLMDKLIITAALTGAIMVPTQTKYLPYTPEAIAAEDIAYVKAGAAAIHIYARDPKTGQPCANPELFGEIARRIKAECNAIIGMTTGGGMGLRFLAKSGLVKGPFWIQFVLGVLGALAANPEDLIVMKGTAYRLFGPENYRWSVIGVGYPAEFKHGRYEKHDGWSCTRRVRGQYL